MMLVFVKRSYITSTSRSNKTIDIKIKWLPPLTPGIKLNINGSYNQNSIFNGIGGVFRDNCGNWIAGFYKRGKGVDDTHMELQAFLQGLEVTIAHELTVAEVETDATEVIKQIQHPSPLFSNIVNDCRYALRKLGNPQIRHNFREGNTVAHMLASEGQRRATSDEVMFLMEPPPWSKDYLYNDSFGGYTTRKSSMLYCNNLAKLSNLSILNSSLAEDEEELLNIPHPPASLEATTMSQLIEVEGGNNPFVTI
ncbi:hypothetical protein MTR67_032355 [Solanum verrucosum]|uniref:RNase H type-1 domain-containing protein n=1 Tax=Solanum verrucosum TaxID=315347 RepID=A0AAF0U4B4_SOLVR|nr:hypothetical protein MTR67_032355 [Solanum verrucosum]